MKIQGLQKMTLLDYPGQVACTVFLGGCDFCCPFCHNYELIGSSAPAMMEDSDLLSFLEGRSGLLDGVAFTGGEPLLRRDLPNLLEAIREMGFKIKIETNGNHPELLKKIAGAGLVDYVAMDIKNSPERYAETIGLDSFDLSRVEESMHFLIGGGVPDYELRTTVVDPLHDADSFEAIARWIEGAGKYYLQLFTDRDTVPFEGLSACSEEEMKSFAEIVRPHVGSVGIRGI